jgi:hypothetical protein
VNVVCHCSKQDAIRRQLRQDEYSEWYPEDVTFQPEVNPPEAWKRASMAASRASVAVRGSARQPLGQRLDDSNQAVRVDVWAAGGDVSAAGSQLAPPSAAKSSASVISNNFGDRLYARKDDKEKKLAAVAASLQPKFKPKTGRAPKGRNLGRQSVGEYLCVPTRSCVCVCVCVCSFSRTTRAMCHGASSSWELS